MVPQSSVDAFFMGWSVGFNLPGATDVRGCWRSRGPGSAMAGPGWPGTPSRVENPLVQKNVKNVVIKNLWWVFHIKVLVYRRDLVALLSYSGNFLHSYGNQWLCRATRGSVGLRPRKLQADSSFWRPEPSNFGDILYIYIYTYTYIDTYIDT